jgi:hypothetical protein
LVLSGVNQGLVGWTDFKGRWGGGVNIMLTNISVFQIQKGTLLSHQQITNILENPLNWSTRNNYKEIK